MTIKSMRWGWGVLSYFSVSLCLSVVSVAHAKSGVGPGIRVVSVEGTQAVVLQKAGYKVGALFPLGTLIEMPALAKDEDAKSTKLRLVVTNGGAPNVALQLGGGTTVRVDRDPKSGGLVADLKRGSLLSRFRRLARKAFGNYQVRTANAVMGVRGTSFFVKAADLKPDFLCVCKGKVEVTRSIAGKPNRKTIVAAHHDTPYWVFADKMDFTTDAMGDDHDDSDLAAMDRLVGEGNK